MYRVVQESLTNVIKHAGPAARAAVVAIDYRRTQLRVDVVDDGRGAAPVGDAGESQRATDWSGCGNGCCCRAAACMPDRVVGGGFSVLAVLPLTGSPTDPATTHAWGRR